MTPERRAAETANKRAERQRRREAGYKRVECWLSAEDVEWVRQMAEDNDDTLADIVAWCVNTMRMETHQ